MTIRVYYEDTDFSGVVYHASYLRFLERGRTEWLREIGIIQGALAQGEALAFAVRRMNIEFIRPARMDDLVDVETHVGAATGATLALHQTIRRDSEVLLTAVVTVVAMSGGKARRLPARLRAFLAQTS